MKIAIINNVDYGSTGTICKELNSFLNKHGFESKFFYGFSNTNKNAFSNRFFQIVGRAITLLFGVNQYKNITLPTKKLIKRLETMKPDLVNLQCANVWSTNLKLLFKYTRKNKIPVVLTGHALFYSTGNCAHTFCDGEFLNACKNCPEKYLASKSLFKNTHKNFLEVKRWYDGNSIRFVGVSDYVTNFAKLSPLTKKFNPVTIYNGINTNVFFYRKKTLNNNINLLFICSDPKSKDKGFDDFKTIVKKFQNNKKYIFHYIGKKIDNFESDNLIMYGEKMTSNQISEIYSQCDLTIVLSKRETFSLPVAESLCCGTPVAFYKSGGPESITIDWCSKIINYGDIESMVSYIESEEFLYLSREQISKQAIAKFSKNQSLESYKKLFCNCLNVAKNCL